VKPRIAITVFTIGILLLGCSTTVLAETRYRTSGSNLNGELEPELRKEILNNPQVKDAVVGAYKKWVIRYYERQTEILTEERDTIWVTNLISNVVCVIVHFVLAISLWMAVSEYRHALALRHSPLGSGPPHPEEAATESTGPAIGSAGDITKLRASLQGISLQTARQGMVMFAMAIMLYFVYLRFVYPITTIEGAAAQSTITRAPAAKEASNNETSQTAPVMTPPTNLLEPPPPPTASAPQR
jgi:hypothetical protein